MDIGHIMLPPQQGGPTEKEVQEYMKDKNLTLEELVKEYYETVNPKTSKPKASTNLIRKILEETKARGKPKAKGGKVKKKKKAKKGNSKKYANGGGVRKVRR